MRISTDLTNLWIITAPNSWISHLENDANFNYRYRLPSKIRRRYDTYARAVGLALLVSGPAGT